MFNLPSRTVRQYYQHTDGEVTTDRATAGTSNVTVMDDLDYTIKTGEYSRKISYYKTQLEVWGDNNVKGYSLDLQHCPEKLQAKLKNTEAWVVIGNAMSVVRLLILIRDLQYNKSNQKGLIMATVKVDFNFYSCAERGKTTDEYYKIVASTVDTINANRGNTRMHTSVFKNYFQPMGGNPECT